MKRKATRAPRAEQQMLVVDGKPHRRDERSWPCPRSVSRLWKPGEVDWLALAIGRVGKGGSRYIAQRPKLPRSVRARWLEHGLADAPFSMVVKLSQDSGIPMESLAKRLTHKTRPTDDQAAA